MNLRPTAASTLALAAGGAQAADPAIEGAGLQALLGLAAVLATIAAAAWLLRRFSGSSASTRGPLQTVAVLALGPKERLVLVECHDTWVMVGVAAGRVSALHSMPKPEHTAAEEAIAVKTATSAIAQAGPGFRQWLDQALRGRAR